MADCRSRLLRPTSWASAIVCASALLLPAPARADDAGDSTNPLSIEIHAFVSQGFIKTSSNNYLAENCTKGSFELSEVGINFSKQLTERMRVGMQRFTHDLGPLGNYRTRFDWFYLDYRFWDWLGLSAGRTKLPFGLYSESSDIDAAGVPVLLPQSVYPVSNDLQATHAQLVQSAKTASLGELVAGVAHEINNPLAFVLSHLDTVRRKLSQLEPELPSPLPPSAQEKWQRANERLNEIGPGLERIRELVIKLRTFSRLDEGERKRVSIRECVESVLTILGHRLRAGIEVETDFGTPDQVDCYASLLNQALMNLISNAIDAMAGSGVLRISTGSQGALYSIIVTDSGPGIPAALRERVLEPFFTTKPVGQGTGLGLSITYSIVRKHQGTIELSEAPGGGASIAIRFPINQGPAPHAS